MVTIITGKINSGKSKKMKQLYDIEKKGDGFISQKNMYKDAVQSYDILKLSTNETRAFVVKGGFYEKEDIACQIGPYVFYRDTLNCIEEDIETMIRDNIQPIYLDEIGQLELYDQCFHYIFDVIMKSGLDCVISVRDDLVTQVLKKYNIKEYTLIKV